MTGELHQVEQPPNACCQDTANRGPTEQVSPELSFTRCGVCGRRHFELELDPGALGVEGDSL